MDVFDIQAKITLDIEKSELIQKIERIENSLKEIAEELNGIKITKAVSMIKPKNKTFNGEDTL